MTDQQRARLAELRKIPLFECSREEWKEKAHLARLEDRELLAKLTRKKQ
ncbi:hypothetical protein ES708_27707 [subsurface metagenome]